MKTPPALKKGDKIGLISTARKISEKELKNAVEVFTDWGLQSVFAPNLFEEYNQFAGTEEQRLADLQGFIDNPEIKAIMCVRGGYGTVQIIDRVNFLSLAESSKWICGYSDITVLLNKLFNVGMESVHSTMPIDFKRISEEGLETLRKVLFGKPISYKIKPHRFNRKGEAHGRIVGGNLSVLYSQLGSPTALNTERRILFFEDLDEYLYHVDRMMQNLQRNGYFDKVVGVIIGSLTGMRDNTIPFGKSAKEIVFETLASYSFPMCFNFPAGHLDDNRAVIFGRRATLKVGNQVTLEFEDGTA